MGTVPSWPFWKIYVDITYIPLYAGKAFIINTRCSLTGFVEARAIAYADSKTIVNFLIKDIFTRYGIS
ncbi:hypothetical protein GE09DRAFT_981743 [Coniochaeta sp. 2T2.1]|nr:hypothetical protein GE09DRAFT_981743 [Coniochaeta sp. 2T2.1]